MNRLIPFLTLVLLTLLSPAAHALDVVATLPWLGDITQRLAPDAQITVLARGTEDPHYLSPTPALMAKVADADLYVENGLNLELWSARLLDGAGNPKIRPGQPGYVRATVGVPVLEVPSDLSRAQGDLHPEGNPHVWLDPLNAIIAADNIAAGLGRVDPAHAAEYTQRAAAFRAQIHERLFGADLVAYIGGPSLEKLARAGKLRPFLQSKGLEARLGGWLGAVKPGAKVVFYHQSWPYFIDRFGIELVGTIEDRPGISPTAAHKAQLAKAMGASGCRIIGITSYYNDRIARALAADTGATVAVLPADVGGVPEATDYFALIDVLVDRVFPVTDLAWMVAPIAASLVALSALGWFGLHVLQREVIFVDLALAQIAALGATYAVYLGHEPDQPFAMAVSLLFTLLGALGFSVLRVFEEKVPTEALIGIAYAVSAALGILLVELADDPHGAEKIQHLLVGNIVWVRWSEIATAAVAVAAMGALHLVFRKPLLQLSFDPDGARAAGVRPALWDLFFYGSFGVVLTAIVNIVGVLLVFSFLVIPAVIGRLVSGSIPGRLAVAYGVGTVASVLGVAVSYEHSTGPIIVGLLGAALALTLVITAVRGAARPGLRAGQIAGGAVAVGLVLAVVARLGAPKAAHDHAAHAVADHPHEVHHDHPDTHAHDDAAAEPADALTRLERAVEQARAGEAAGLQALAALTTEDAAFIRMEAHDRLVIVAGEQAPAYDPLAGPDADGVWAAWATAPPEGWQARATGLALP